MAENKKTREIIKWANSRHKKVREYSDVRVNGETASRYVPENSGYNQALDDLIDFLKRG